MHELSAASSEMPILIDIHMGFGERLNHDVKVCKLGAWITLSPMHHESHSASIDLGSNPSICKWVEVQV